jgi:gentisate 1,2-dioxygenase
MVPCFHCPIATPVAHVYSSRSDEVCTLWQIFEPDHETPPHVHDTAHELFFILSGRGTAFCDGRRFDVGVGDVVVFPPTAGTIWWLLTVTPITPMDPKHTFDVKDVLLMTLGSFWQCTASTMAARRSCFAWS